MTLAARMRANAALLDRMLDMPGSPAKALLRTFADELDRWADEVAALESRKRA